MSLTFDAVAVPEIPGVVVIAPPPFLAVAPPTFVVEVGPPTVRFVTSPAEAGPVLLVPVSGPAGAQGEDGEQGIPGVPGVGIKVAERSFALAVTPWVWVHNLGTKAIEVNCYELDGVTGKPVVADVIDENTVSVTWYYPEPGILQILY